MRALYLSFTLWLLFVPSGAVHAQLRQLAGPQTFQEKIDAVSMSREEWIDLLRTHVTNDKEYGPAGDLFRLSGSLRYRAEKLREQPDHDAAMEVKLQVASALAQSYGLNVSIRQATADTPSNRQPERQQTLASYREAYENVLQYRREMSTRAGTDQMFIRSWHALRQAALATKLPDPGKLEP